MYIMLKTVKIAVNKDQITYRKGEEYNLPEGEKWSKLGYCKKKEGAKVGKTNK